MVKNRLSRMIYAGKMTAPDMCWVAICINYCIVKFRALRCRTIFHARFVFAVNPSIEKYNRDLHSICIVRVFLVKKKDTSTRRSR